MCNDYTISCLVVSTLYQERYTNSLVDATFGSSKNGVMQVKWNQLIKTEENLH